MDTGASIEVAVETFQELQAKKGNQWDIKRSSIGKISKMSMGPFIILFQEHLGFQS